MDIKYKIIADIDADIWNWQDMIKKETSYGRSFLERLPKNISKEQVLDDKFLKKYLEGNYYRGEAVTKYADYMQAAFDGTNISNDLKDIVGFGLPYKDILLKITTFSRCPYDYRKGSLFIVYGSSAKYATTVTYHECMHMLVHKYFWHLFEESGLSNSEAHDIKEALTVLLNPKLMDRDLPEDRGYKIHQELRSEITKLSESGLMFEEIILGAIKFYKKHSIGK